MTERTGKQLHIVATELKIVGSVSAHQLLIDHGITRLAPIIHTLRHIYGWGIETVRGRPGYMASYVLESAPISWNLPRRATAKATWSCTTCGQVRADSKGLVNRTPTIAVGVCPTCAASRLFRLA